MIYIYVFFLALLDLSFTAFVCILVNWWAPLFASSDGWLPKWLKWIQTFDADLDTGVRQGLVKADTQYWGRVKWLYRNPAYGFSYYALGAKWVPVDWTVLTYTGSEDLPEFKFYAVSKSGLFNLHCRKFGLKWKIGWKAWNCFLAPDGWKPTPWGPEWRIPFVFSITRG